MLPITALNALPKGACRHHVSRHVLCRVFHSQNLHGAGLDQYTVKNDVVSMRHQFAHIVRQAGTPGATKLRVPCKRPGLVAQLLAEPARLDRVVLADVGHDGAQILAGLRPPFNAVSGLCRHKSVGQLGTPCAHERLEISLVAQAVRVTIHAGDKGEHRHHIGRNVGIHAP